MKKYIITNDKEKFIQDDLNESYEMEYVVWVLDGDDNQWKKYKGAHTDKINKDAFLKSINYKVYPNFDVASNFIDVKVLPAGKSPMDESYGKTTDGKTIDGEFSKDGKTFTDKDGNEYPVNDGGEIIDESRYNRYCNESDYASKAQDEYSNIKIDVYDIKKFVEQNTDGKYTPFDFHTGAAVLFKPDGSGCIVDFEAIGESFNSINDTIVLRLNDIPEEGKFYIMPQYDADVTVKEIIDDAPHKTMTVDEFFTKRNYNSRCIQNFDDIKEYLK